jgi:hypothetical protein
MLVDPAGESALIDELIDFLTTGKSGALLISELRRHGSRQQHQLSRRGDGGNLGSSRRGDLVKPVLSQAEGAARRNKLSITIRNVCVSF